MPSFWHTAAAEYRIFPFRASLINQKFQFLPLWKSPYDVKIISHAGVGRELRDPLYQCFHSDSSLRLGSEARDSMWPSRSGSLQLHRQHTMAWQPQSKSSSSNYFHCHDWLFLCQSHFPSSLLIFRFCKNDSVWFSSWKRTWCLGKDGGMKEKGKGREGRKCPTPNGFDKRKVLMKFEITINYASKAETSGFSLWIFISMISFEGIKIGWNSNLHVGFFFKTSHSIFVWTKAGPWIDMVNIVIFFVAMMHVSLGVRMQTS